MASRISVSVSADLRYALEEAREKSGRTLTDEVEMRLRESLRTPASEGIILLKLDEGLFAWLCAYVEGIGFCGSIEETAIYFIRQGIIEASKNKVFEQMMYPYLPPNIQASLRKADIVP